MGAAGGPALLFRDRGCVAGDSTFSASHFTADAVPLTFSVPASTPILLRCCIDKPQGIRSSLRVSRWRLSLHAIYLLSRRVEPVLAINADMLSAALGLVLTSIQFHGCGGRFCRCDHHAGLAGWCCARCLSNGSSAFGSALIVAKRRQDGFLRRAGAGVYDCGKIRTPSLFAL